MSALRKRPPDPGTVCRELRERAAAGRLPRLLLLAPPTRGEEEPWFAEQVMAAARDAARSRPDLDFLDLDGGPSDFPAASLEGFLQAVSLFAQGGRALLLDRADKALSRAPRLQALLVSAFQDSGGPEWMILRFGKNSAKVLSGLQKALGGAKSGAELVRFRRLYGDPPPWRPHDLDASEAAQFATAEARRLGLRLAPGAAGLLVQVAGPRPAELCQALAHFSLLELDAVGEEQIREVVAHSAEGSAFEYAEALLRGDARAALRLLRRLRERGLRTWDGRRLGPQEAFSLLLAVLAGERRRTAAVRAGVRDGASFAEACQQAGVAPRGPAAKRMEARLRDCDEAQLAKVLRGLRRSEVLLKGGERRDALHVLEEFAFSVHRGRR